MPRQKARRHTAKEFPQGGMVKGGEAFSHKYSRINGIKISFHREFVTLGHSCSSGQQSCSGISLEDGWYPQSTTFKNQPVNFELSTISSHHNYDRVSSKQVKCQSRLGVQECNRLIRFETSLKCFSEITKILGTPSVDLFASRLCHQLPEYMAWKPDANSFVADAMQQDWNKMFAFAFPPFSLIGWIIKILRENVEIMILVTPTWHTQPWYAVLLRMSIQRLFLLPALPNLLLNPLGGNHPLVKTRSLRLGAWKIT